MANSLNLHIVFEKAKITRIEFQENKTDKVSSVIITVFGDNQLYNKMEFIKKDFLNPLFSEIYKNRDKLFFAKYRTIYINDEPKETEVKIQEKPEIQKALYQLEFVFENKNIYEYLYSLPTPKRQVLLQHVKNYNINQLLQFLQRLKIQGKNKSAHNLITDVINISNNSFLKTIHVEKPIALDNVCQQTYGGFLRALKTNTLQHITAEIDGQPKALFVKTGIGDLPKNKQYSNDPLLLGGYSTLAIDAENLNVYSFKTNEQGKLDNNSLKLVMDYKNLAKYLKEERKYLIPKIKELAKEFQKELIHKLDKKYHRGNIPGTQIIKKTFERLKPATHLK
ncbi:MAG: hypothetical protein WC932_05575 [archaeon]|jgi:hypothetical protein